MFGIQYSRALLSALAVLPAVNCIAFGGPAPTAISPEKGLNGWTPKPTQAPSVAELRRRQGLLDSQTCGWVDGLASSWVTCSLGRTCMLYTASGVGMAGCCDGSDQQACGWASSCVDYNDYYSSSSCDSDCSLNTFVRKCTNILQPYCVTWSYPYDNVKDFGCAETSAFSVETILFSGGSSSVSLSTLGGSDVRTDASQTDTDLFDFTTTNAAGETSISISGGGRRKKGKKKVSIGAIAGAVIGGLVILFVIGALLICICVKQKKKRQLLANQTAIAAAQAGRPQSQFNPAMQQQQQGPAQPLLAPMPPQSPPLGSNTSYYHPPSQQPEYSQQPYQQPSVYGQPPLENKYNQSQVREQPVQSPVSNPPTPSPAYVQPYYAAPNAAAPPMPAQSPGPYQTREPLGGAHEADSTTTYAAPQPQRGQQGQDGNVYEIGHR